jgi:4-hydroxyphenylpyruvate dioxygenase-like putative hemolysin
MEWRERVAEMEQKVAEAQAQSQKVTKTVQTRVVTKTQVVRTRGEDIVKYVDREVVRYNTKFAPGGQCELPREFVKAINDAAEAPK